MFRFQSREIEQCFEFDRHRFLKLSVTDDIVTVSSQRDTFQQIDKNVAIRLRSKFNILQCLMLFSGEKV